MCGGGFDCELRAARGPLGRQVLALEAVDARSTRRLDG
ncbi:hypothetical protein BZL30_0436 [Mycobacterium kansasii]|uniref:Uncharacterized protein n=1 Tax=Mycobacterium kansasii TaxID=1768 RepID=A0A1V3XS90_MYCKA|nr:hypothetical protein BZL30_0436 [Mycobacterium kansasii]